MNSFWDFFWLLIVTFLLFAYLMVLFQIVIDIFRDHELNGWLKAIWVLFLVIFPFLTALIYLIARGGGMAKRQMSSAVAAQRDTEAYIQQVAGSGASPAEEIARAKALHDAGTITDAEFDALKKKALG